MQRAARERLGLEADVHTFGFIGQLREVKGLLDLLDSLAPLRERSWQLVVAGEDHSPGKQYEASCRDRVQALALETRVRFVGFLEDVAVFYNAIDAAVVPSRAEPLGRVPLEAAAWGRPAVACAVGGLTETIVDGSTGWLVPANDLPSLTAALAATFEPTVVRARGRAARQHVTDEHAPHPYAQQMAQLYRAVVQ